LRAVWAARRAERLRVQQQGIGLATVQRAIAGVRRDRDAATSAALRRDRALFEQLLGDVDDLACLLARTSVRLGTLGVAADAPQTQSVVATAQAGLAALADLAATINTPTDTHTHLAPEAAPSVSSTAPDAAHGERTARHPNRCVTSGGEGG
jgi:hypothetical protein